MAEHGGQESFMYEWTFVEVVKGTKGEGRGGGSGEGTRGEGRGRE